MLRFALVAFAVFVSSSAQAAEYFVCEAEDGTVHITDRASAVPEGCRAERVALEGTKSAPTPEETAARNAAIDAAVEVARANRARREARTAEFPEEARALRERLVEVRLKLTDARDRLYREKYRWSALFPGDWVVHFADAEEIEMLEKQMAFLVDEEKRVLEKIDALRREAIVAGVGRTRVDEILPAEEPTRDERRAPEGYVVFDDHLGWGRQSTR